MNTQELLADPESRKHINALASEIKEIANNMYLQMFTDEPNIQVSDFQVSHNGGAFQPQFSQSPERPDIYASEATIKELDKLHAKIDEALKKSFDSSNDLYTSENTQEMNNKGYPSSIQTQIYSGSTYSPYLSEPQGKITDKMRLQIETDPKIRQFSQNQYISPKYDQIGEKYTRNHYGYASEPQVKDYEANFFQDKKGNWSANNESYYVQDQPKSSALPNESKFFDQAKTVSSWNPAAITPLTVTSKQSEGEIISQPHRKSSQLYDQAKLDRILSNITQGGSLRTLETKSRSQSISLAKPRDYQVYLNQGHDNYQSVPIDQINRDFVDLKIDTLTKDTRDVLTPTPFRIEAEHEVSKSSFSPLLDTATHRRAKTGVDYVHQNKEPFFYNSATKPYEANPERSSVSSFASYDPFKRFGENKQNYNGKQNYGMDTIEERIEDSIYPSKRSINDIRRNQQEKDIFTQIRERNENYGKLRASIEEILSRPESGNTDIKFVRRLPDTTHEQYFTNTEPTLATEQTEKEYRINTTTQTPPRGNRSSREDSYSPLRQSPSGEKTVIKQERAGRVDKVERVEKKFKIPKEMEKKMKFMNKTEVALM